MSSHLVPVPHSSLLHGEGATVHVRQLKQSLSEVRDLDQTHGVAV